MENTDLERSVLRNFFEKICVENPLDSSISDSKVVRDAKNQLRVALRNATERCSCAKRSYDICEVCMGSDRELILLRNFFRMVRDAKKNSLEPALLQDFIKNNRESVRAAQEKNA